VRGPAGSEPNRPALRAVLTRPLAQKERVGRPGDRLDAGESTAPPEAELDREGHAVRARHVHVELEGTRRLSDHEARDELLHLGLPPLRAIARVPGAVRVARLGRQGLVVRPGQGLGQHVPVRLHLEPVGHELALAEEGGREPHRFECRRALVEGQDAGVAAEDGGAHRPPPDADEIRAPEMPREIVRERSIGRQWPAQGRVVEEVDQVAGERVAFLRLDDPRCRGEAAVAVPQGQGAVGQVVARGRPAPVLVLPP